MNTTKLFHKTNFSIKVGYIERSKTFCQPVTGTIPFFHTQQIFSHAEKILLAFQDRVSSETFGYFDGSAYE
jgi:hypothetical protein